MKKRQNRSPKTQHGLSIPRGSEKYLAYDENGNETWVIDKIVDERIAKNGQKEFLIKWRGWSHKYNTWEPKSHIPGEIEEYGDSLSTKLKKIYLQSKKIRKPVATKTRQKKRKSSTNTKFILKKISNSLEEQNIENSQNPFYLDENGNSIVYQVQSPVYWPNQKGGFDSETFELRSCDGDSNTTKVHSEDNDDRNQGSYNFNLQFISSPPYQPNYDLEKNDFFSPLRIDDQEENVSSYLEPNFDRNLDLSHPFRNLGMEDAVYEIKECYVYRNFSNQNDFRFKVAIFDSRRQELRDHEFLSYEEIIQKKLESVLAEFYIRETLSYINKYQRSFSEKIKLL